MLLDEIPEGLWEVDFFEKSSEKEIIYYRRLMANLRRPTWEVRIWILGMWAVPYPIINISLASKIDILLHYWIIPENPQKYIKSPIYPLTLIPG